MSDPDSVRAYTEQIRTIADWSSLAELAEEIDGNERISDEEREALFKIVDEHEAKIRPLFCNQPCVHAPLPPPEPTCDGICGKAVGHLDGHQDEYGHQWVGGNGS